MIGHFAWIAETFYEALRICPESLSIQPRIHITQPMNLPNDVDILTLERQGQDVPPSSLLSCEKKIDFEHSLWPEVKLVRGRPDIPRLLEEEITAALGPVSVDGESARVLIHFQFPHHVRLQSRALLHLQNR